MNELLEQKIKRYTADCLADNRNGHDLAHAERVVTNIRQIISASNAQVNSKNAITAGYVHDIIDRKVADNIELAHQKLIEFLASCEYSTDEIEQISVIINNMSYSKGMSLDTLEGQIVQDADRLEALGAIGIIRTFIYGNEHNRPFYLEDDKEFHSSIGHFHEKLYHVRGKLNTDAAKAVAENREQFLYQFEEQLISELTAEIN